MRPLPPRRPEGSRWAGRRGGGRHQDVARRRHRQRRNRRASAGARACPSSGDTSPSTTVRSGQKLRVTNLGQAHSPGPRNLVQLRTDNITARNTVLNHGGSKDVERSEYDAPAKRITCRSGDNDRDRHSRGRRHRHLYIRPRVTEQRATHRGRVRDLPHEMAAPTCAHRATARRKPDLRLPGVHRDHRLTHDSVRRLSATGPKCRAHVRGHLTTSGAAAAPHQTVRPGSRGHWSPGRTRARSLPWGGGE